MALNSRYRDFHGGAGLEMNSIPGPNYNPYISTQAKKNEDRSNSPIKDIKFSGKAEVLSADLVRSNETKVKNQISFANKAGALGPFLDFDANRPAPKSPQIPMGSSAYKMQFSPGKKREDIPLKLQDNNSVFHSMSSSHGTSMRHMSNQDSYLRGSYMSNSIDYGKNKKSINFEKPVVSRAKQISYDNGQDHFRFKKNLTVNADRILKEPQMAGYSQTPVTGVSKYEEIRRAASKRMETMNSDRQRNGSTGVTFNVTDAQENYNYNNIQKYKSRQPSPPAEEKQLTNANSEMFYRPKMKEPIGNYNTINLKKSLGITPSSDFKSGESDIKNSMHLRSSLKIGESSSMAGFNDPAYARKKNINNYGFDVLTGVRKESPNRAL